MAAPGSSSTSSRTSTSSSTSDGAVPAPYGGRTASARAAGLVRLTHPFPSALDGLATAAIALVAGAAPAEAVRLGVAMTALQAAIGTWNDIVDTPADTEAKPAKPIPAGLVSRRAATGIALGSSIVGLVLSGASGWGTALIALVILGIGLAYDLRLKGTAWSWLPFAIGIPLLPLYAWYGAVGSLPSAFAVLVPAGVAAGAALAIGNARADLERDEASGVASIATALGPRRAWVAETAILIGVSGVALGAAAVAGATIGQLLVVGLAACVPLAAAIGSRGAGPSGRERAWEAEAVGVAVLGVAWLWVALA